MADTLEKIIVLNSKGGCGKTTIATNLASLYSREGFATALMDYDPQGSSLRWLKLRPREARAIYAVPAVQQKNATTTLSWQMRVPPETQRIIIDAPAGVDDFQLQNFVRQANTILIPVLPSPIDIHAATRFIETLLLVGKVRQHGVRVGVVANRVKQNTKIYQSLQRFLDTLKLPLITTLRDTQHYVRAAERGIGVNEMWDKRADIDREQWQPLWQWLERSHLKLQAGPVSVINSAVM
ncbi:MAG: ParA family protein [Gammaproteobacteria bacterium]